MKTQTSSPRSIATGFEPTNTRNDRKATTMNFSNELQMLLNREVPRMLPEGEQRFRRMMDEAVAGVVRQAFDEKDLAAFHVTQMVVR